MIFVPCSHFAYTAYFSMAHATTDRRLVLLAMMRRIIMFGWEWPGSHGLSSMERDEQGQSV
jgi:hypothetical protein